MGVVRILPEDDEFGMAARLHEADGVQKRGLAVADVGSVPAVFPYNFGNLVVHTLTAAERNRSPARRQARH